jgi:hypothetical protein
MGVLLARCPVTDKKFSTGIQVQTTIDALPQVRTRSYCPYCKAEHVWWTGDAILVDVIPPSEWVENEE